MRTELIRDVENPPLDFEGRGTVQSTGEGPLHQPAAGPPPPQKRGRNEGGFTLVELMVVLVILGLLATIVIINVLPAADRAKLTAAHASVTQLEQAIEMYNLNNHRYPTSQEGLPVLVTSRL